MIALNGISYMKNINKFSIIISVFLSAFITIKVYDFLYTKFNYINLPDFYAGSSIYLDHNKFLDIYIYFIYLICFFVLLPLISLFFKKTDKKENKRIRDKNKKSQISYINKYFNFQYIFPLFYICLHPFNGIIYKKLILIIITLILISIYDIYQRGKKEEKTISPFAISALLFGIYFYTYNIQIAPVDDHHFGEKFATFFLHENFHLQYYKDIMLVHGYIDVISPWFGKYIFNSNNIYGYCLGEILLRNINFLLLLIPGFYLFKKNFIFLTPMLFIKMPSITSIYVITFLCLLNKNIFKRSYIWLSIYIIISFIFFMVWTTIGTFWIVASLPAAIYIIYRQIKNSSSKDNINFIFPASLLLMLLFLSKNILFNFFEQAAYYIKGNLYAFGNNFGSFNICIQQILYYSYKLFALLIIPIFIIELFYRLKEKYLNIRFILFLIFAIIFPIISLGYTMARIDGELMQRIEYISVPYLLILFPFYIYIKNSAILGKKLKLFLYTLLSLALINGCLLLIPKLKKIYYIPSTNNSILMNVGKINLDTKNMNRLEELNSIINYNDTFYDLTNRGMHYLYLNKKINVPFISFYNSITEKQAEISLKNLKENPPDKILIYSESNIHDNIFPSLRINPIYRWVLLSKKYQLVKYNKNIILKKSKNDILYSKEDLQYLDYILSNSNLLFLPEVWGNSINTLKLKENMIKYKTTYLGDKIIIQTEDDINGKNIGLLYFKPVSKQKLNVKYTIKINNSESELECRSKNGTILIPMDNFPSWLVNDKINKIEINADKNLPQSFIVNFYIK